MYQISYILHIAGVAIWIGSFITLGVLLKSLTIDKKDLADYAPIMQRIQQWVMKGVFPSLALILLSGVYMIMQYNRDSLPLYITLMEQAGTIIILFTLIVISIYSKRITKTIHDIPLKKPGTLTQFTKIYANYLIISTLLGIGIIVIVGLRLT